MQLDEGNTCSNDAHKHTLSNKDKIKHEKVKYNQIYCAEIKFNACKTPQKIKLL